MKRALTSVLAILLILSMCVSCHPGTTDLTPTPVTPTPVVTPLQTASPEAVSTHTATAAVTATPAPTPTKPAVPTLNGVALDQYVIVYSPEELDYNLNAAHYIRDSVKTLTGLELAVKPDTDQAGAHEILVGETSRSLSKKLKADTQGLQFALLADEDHIAMEAEYFVIAAAAYYFVDTYITGAQFTSRVPKTLSVNTPIVEKPKNYLFLIGDGMGLYQSQLFEYMNPPADLARITTDGEDRFYGYMFPYMGMVGTDSFTEGATDSAASATALATGYKTYNGYIGKDKNGNDVMSLTELARELGMATAVVSTETTVGATPAAFSAHVLDRSDERAIDAQQLSLEGTVVDSLWGSFNDETNTAAIKRILDSVSGDEDGFFLMYEEAYIDKHSHNNNMDMTYLALSRFNQAIGLFMEYAFYHPDTLVLITADHETGDLRPDGNGKLQYHSDSHSRADVCVFAYGVGAEIFDGRRMENVQIPKTIAEMWGRDGFGDPASPYGALTE